MRVACASRPPPPPAARGVRRSRHVGTRAVPADRSFFSSRRAALLSVTLMCGSPLEATASPSPPPPTGDCPECVGVINDLLNSCPDTSESCVSSQNDDETHFCAPWAYSGNRTAAMEYLVTTITRKDAIDPVGCKNGGGRGMKPGREEGSTSSLNVVATIANYVEQQGYVHLEINIKTKSGDERKDENSATVFDLEVLLWDDDEVVNVRCAARDAPKKGSGSFSLSYVDGVKFSKNTARDVAEATRIALGWEILPVISGFDPRFNNSKRLWFEKALDFGGFDASVMDQRNAG